jgi:hypothetical protein
MPRRSESLEVLPQVTVDSRHTRTHRSRGLFRGRLLRRGVGGAPGFRWRSNEITRVEGFSDAVFAFAITLLVVSLEVPKTFSELLESMRGFAAFAIAFTLLCYIWYNQYLYFRRYGLQDGWTITLNSALLFVVLFFVYPLKFLFSYLVRGLTGGATDIRLPTGIVVPVIDNSQTATLMIIYGLGYVAVFGLFTLMHIHAYRCRDTLELSALEQFDTRSSIQQNLIQVTVGLISVMIAMVGGSGAAFASGMTYILIGPVMTVNGIVIAKKRASFGNLSS